MASKKYFSCLPNRGARLGHQFHEWFRFYMLCKDKGYIFVHHPFICNSENQDSILNLSHGEILYDDIVSDKEVLVITNCDVDINEFINGNFDSDICYVYCFYEGEKRQTNSFFDYLLGRENEYSSILREKFIYDERRNNTSNFETVSVHLRFDDVADDDNRALGFEYYDKILNKFIHNRYNIRLFTDQLDHEVVNRLLNKYDNSICVRGGIEDDIRAMVHSDIFIASKSGFSYIVSLLTDAKKIVPSGFWHPWPKDSIFYEDFICLL